MCSPDPGSVRKLCKIFPEAVLWSRSQTIFPGAGARAVESQFAWSQSWCWSHCNFFCPSPLSIILTTLHFLEYSARKPVKNAKDHEETGSNCGAPKKSHYFNHVPFPQFSANDCTSGMSFPAALVDSTDHISSQTLL